MPPDAMICRNVDIYVVSGSGQWRKAGHLYNGLSFAYMEIPMETSVLHAAGTNRVQNTALRVLVVDDNVDSAKTLAILVKTIGHEAQAAHDGATALIMANELRPHVIFLDVGLPGIDGFEVARRIREERSSFNVVLVAITGYGQERDEQFTSAGFDYHLVKPADFKDIRQILDAIPR